MPTTDQFRLIHVAARQVGLIDAGGDERYRMLLQNAAGVTSATKLNNTTFEDVMAIMEDMGFSMERQRHIDRTSITAGGGSAARAQSTYWRDKVAARGRNANERMVFKINELAKQVHRYELRGLCRRQASGRTDDPAKLTPREAFELIEMMKAIIARETRGSSSPPTAASLGQSNSVLSVCPKASTPSLFPYAGNEQMYDHPSSVAHLNYKDKHPGQQDESHKDATEIASPPVELLPQPEEDEPPF